MNANLKKVIVILALFVFVFLLNPFPISAFEYSDTYASREPGLKIGMNVTIIARIKFEADYLKGKILALDGRGLIIKRDSDGLNTFFPWDIIGCLTVL
jgi:hypothetical protein